MSTLTCENPWDPSISRSFGEVDSNASRVTALWLESQTCACPPCKAIRTSMGPSAGGFTWSFALVRLPSIISDTRSATPCPNCAVSTPAATLKVGVGAASVELFEVNNCAAPALPSFAAPASVASGLLPCERLSVAPAALPESACVIEAAAAAVAAADRDAAEARANAAAGDPAAGSLELAAPSGPPDGAIAESSDEALSSKGALVPCTAAAAMAACEAASGPATADPVFRAESLTELIPLEADPELPAALSGVLFAFAIRALAAAAGTAAVFDAPAKASVRMLSAWGMFMPEAIAVGPLADADTAAASAPAGAEDDPGSGETCDGAGDSGTSASRVGKGTMPTAPSAAAGTDGAAAIVEGAAPCALPCIPLAEAAASAAAAEAAAAAAGESVLRGGGEPPTGGRTLIAGGG